MKGKEREHGQAAVLLALALVGLIAFAALAIDGGNAYLMRRNSQNASDAGAFAGSREVYLIRHKPWDVDCINDATVGACLLRVVNDATERNGVPDTNGVSGDETNDNVVAYFVDSAGERAAQITSDWPVDDVPLSDVSMGVLVENTIRFDTFIAGLIGRSEMAATTRSATLLQGKVNAVNNAIWADSDCYLSTACSITGDSQMVDGGIHSNAELKIEPSGEGSVYTGTLEYAAPDHYVNLDKIELYPAPSITNPVQVPVDFLEPLFDINDYDYRVEGSKIPTPTIVGEGYLFDGVDYYFYPDNGAGTKPQMVMAEGLHFSADQHGLDMGTDGSAVPLAITVVSVGEIKYHVKEGDVSLLFPYVDGILLFSTAGEKGCPSNITAVNMSINEARWEGLIYAPNGHVDMSFSGNAAFRGAIVAWTIAISGSDFQLTYDPRYDPDLDPRVTLYE
jgi:hypothetical protein